MRKYNRSCTEDGYALGVHKGHILAALESADGAQ